MALTVGIGMVLTQDIMSEKLAIIMAHYFNMLRFATLVGGGLIGLSVEYFAIDDLLVSISLLPAIGMVVLLLWWRPVKSS